MELDDPHLTRLAELDRRLVKLGTGIKVLSRLSWPSPVQEAFAAARARGARELPRVDYAPEPMTERIAALRDLQRDVDSGHPLGRYLDDTAQSYIAICRLLENAGSPRMTPFSLELYGRPGDSLAGGRVTNTDAARHFLEVAAEYSRECRLAASDYCLPAGVVQAELVARLGAVFTGHDIAVEVDPDLVSKAAAGASRVRLRDATCFSEFDVEQLLQHEVFVHSLTAINGREQPFFPAWGWARRARRPPRRALPPLRSW